MDLLRENGDVIGDCCGMPVYGFISGVCACCGNSIFTGQPNDKPMSMQVESERVIDVEKVYSPSASFWRGDVRESTLGPGMNFNLVDDSNINSPDMIGQFRVLTMTRAPEGYTAIVAVASKAVLSQIPTILTSRVIKSTMVLGLLGPTV